ncbi:hypothetical protein [Bradyrhizobium tunisiense]|uniref:hypothetical protein n=1 Tax=Bradyrhizobium tunisiense TaxID=3278709 RepID=UPI0035D61F4C
MAKAAKALGFQIASPLASVLTEHAFSVSKLGFEVMTYITDWTKPGSFSAGRDPLGFQAASVRLYTSLVPGLTNVTNRLRYYSFYCWVVWQFEQIHHTTKEDKWVEFIRRCEAAIALACQIGDAANAFGMAGSEWWRYEAADTSKKAFDLINPTNRPGEDGQYLKAKYGNFGQFYTASMLEMGLIDSASARVFGVTGTAGKALALAVQKEHPEACTLLLKAVKVGRITRSDCKTISEALHPSYLDPSSREARLLKAILQGDRADDPTAEARRISLRNVLAVVSDSKGEFDLRRELYVQSGSLGASSQGGENLTRWRAYFLNEFCHIALEVWLNAIVGLSNQVAEPTAVDALAATLAALAVGDETASTESLAVGLALKSLRDGHDLGSELLAIASVKKRPEASAVAASTKLILSLWIRWREKALIREALLRETVEGRSVEGVFRFLDLNSAANARFTIAKLIKKFVVSNHLMIAGQKLATGGRFTYRFMLDDGCLVDGEFGEYTYTQPRIANLLTFARDADLVDRESGIITAAGAEFLNAA